MPRVQARQEPPAAGEMPSTRFEVRDQKRRVACTVSDEALEAVSSLVHPSSALLRRQSFDRFRVLIDSAARLKLSTMPDSFAGPLVILPADLRRVPAGEGVPQFGSSSWTMRQASRSRSS